MIRELGTVANSAHVYYELAARRGLLRADAGDARPWSSTSTSTSTSTKACMSTTWGEGSAPTAKVVTNTAQSCRASKASAFRKAARWVASTARWNGSTSPLHIHAIVTADGYRADFPIPLRRDPHVGRTSEPRSTPDSTVFDIDCTTTCRTPRPGRVLPSRTAGFFARPTNINSCHVSCLHRSRAAPRAGRGIEALFVRRVRR